SHALLNHIGVGLVGKLNDFSATVHIVGVALLVGVLAFFARAEPWSFLAQGPPPGHEGPAVYLFSVSLLQAMWTFTGFDASAHVAEDTHDPARRAPWGIVLSVVVSGFFGYFLVTGLALAIAPGELSTLTGDETAPLTIVRHALGEGAGRSVMGLVIAAMW